jgi:hypothetical protein
MEQWQITAAIPIGFPQVSENQSPTPVNRPEHGKNEPALSGGQPPQEQSTKVKPPRGPEKTGEPVGTSPPLGTPEKKS